MVTIIAANSRLVPGHPPPLINVGLQLLTICVREPMFTSPLPGRDINRLGGEAVFRWALMGCPTVSAGIVASAIFHTRILSLV